MAKISGREKFRKWLTGSYSEKLTYQLAQEKAEQLAAAKMAEKARLEAAAKKKAAEEAAKKVSRVEKVKADAKKTPSQPAKKPASAGKTASTTPKKATAKPAPKKATGYNAKAVDGDGDGLVQDGTPFERPAAPKKKATGTGGSSATKKRR
jgi:hypothetical protein